MVSMPHACLHISRRAAGISQVMIFGGGDLDCDMFFYDGNYKYDDSFELMMMMRRKVRRRRRRWRRHQSRVPPLLCRVVLQRVSVREGVFVVPGRRKARVVVMMMVVVTLIISMIVAG